MRVFLSCLVSSALRKELQTAQLADSEKRPEIFTPSEWTQNDGFVIKTEDDLPSLQTKLADAFGDVEFSVEPFFLDEDDENLKKFYDVQVPSVRLANLASGPFEYAYALQDELGLLSCEPEFLCDVPVTEEPETFTKADDDTVQWELENARVKEAWQYSKDTNSPVAGEGIIIAQIDTGSADHLVVPFDGDVWHPDGMNFKDPERSFDPEAKDPFDQGMFQNPGHGHRVAFVAAGDGTVAGNRNLLGSAYNAQILPMRAIKSVAVFGGQFKPIAKAVRAAVRNGAHVITMSLGGFLAPDVLMKDAFENAVENDVIVVAAAGQVGWGLNPFGVAIPARYQEVIAVAGSTENDEPWSDSFNGKQVDFAAPSVDILVPDRTESNGSTKTVQKSDGTSYATALTGGIAACWLAHHGRENLIKQFGERHLQEAFRLCCKQTVSHGQNWQAGYGAGIINAEAIMKKDTTRIFPGSFSRLLSSAFRRIRRAPKLADELVDMGVDRAQVDKLSNKDLQKYGKELVWLGMESSENYTSVFTATMSPSLREMIEK